MNKDPNGYREEAEPKEKKEKEKKHDEDKMPLRREETQIVGGRPVKSTRERMSNNPVEFKIQMDTYKAEHPPIGVPFVMGTGDGLRDVFDKLAESAKATDAEQQQEQQ